MWFTLGKLALKTGAEIYRNKKRAAVLESEAEVKHLERAVKGEVELQKIVHKRQESDFKDEFCLILLSLPLLILAYSVFFGDPELQQRVDYFFQKFENLPFWYQGLVIGAFSTILGIRGVSAIKKK
tara:strand:+ start:3342 stop:3719 length:378 start_codon:yes stop_codon:yes gene_type:complete